MDEFVWHVSTTLNIPEQEVYSRLIDYGGYCDTYDGLWYKEEDLELKPVPPNTEVGVYENYQDFKHKRYAAADRKPLLKCLIERSRR